MPSNNKDTKIEDTEKIEEETIIIELTKEQAKDLVDIISMPITIMSIIDEYIRSRTEQTLPLLLTLQDIYEKYDIFDEDEEELEEEKE